METALKFILPLYLLVFFAAAFAWRSFLVWRRTSVNPFAFRGGDNAHAFIGRLFGKTLAAVAAAVLIYALAPGGQAWLVPLFWLSHPALAYLGLALLGVALAWVLAAQAQMGASWRIGIDAHTPAPLVQTGLFAISRNPIFLGMRVMLLGLLLVMPTAVTLAIAVLGEALIHIQVRLEEPHLSQAHGARYRDYAARVRRWL
jgi:protein-S-isoprenylcysteine O-methyltransferase Ste14